jgi:hypothetical protein
MTPLHPLIEATFTILDEPSGEAWAVLRNG